MLTSRRLQFARSQAVKSHKCIFSCSLPNYPRLQLLRQLKSLQTHLTHTLLYSHITFGGCCCPDPEICGGKITQSGLLYRLNWMFCVSLLSVIVKGCVVIVSIVQHAAVHRQRCDAFGAFNGYCRLIFFARTPPNMEYCLL